MANIWKFLKIKAILILITPYSSLKEKEKCVRLVEIKRFLLKFVSCYLFVAAKIMRINALFATSKVHCKRKQKHVYERNVCIITFFREDTPCRRKRLFDQNFFLQQHYLTAILCIKTISNIANGNSIPICISTKNMQIKSSIIYNVPKISFITKLEHIFITIQNFNLYHRTLITLRKIT